MAKGEAKSGGRRFRWLITAFVALLFIGAATSSVYYLRQNNLKMLELRQEVFDADKNDGDVSTALSNLQQYVASHMNTKLPKLGDEKAIQLKYTYERLVAAEAARVSAARTKLNLEATEYCQKTYAASSFAVRTQCVQDYYDARPITELTIPNEAYGYDFVSPLWSPDIAGWSLVAAGVLGVVLILRILSTLIIRRSLRSTM